MAGESYAVQPSPGLGQYDLQQDDYTPPLSSLSSTAHDLVYSPNTQSYLHIGMDPLVSTAGFISLLVSSATPLVTVGAANYIYTSSPTNLRRTKKIHPCHQCGKTFARRELAEGCENRHQNLRPLSCTKQCGESNWYVS
jgi:hypothetical protein